MSGVIKCPNCKTPLFVADEMIGQVMACPTCQRPIHFVGTAPSSAADPLVAAPPSHSSPKHRLPQAAPLAPLPAPLPALEPAPAAPKYSAEVTQFALQPDTTAAPTKPREEGYSPVVLITWAVLGLLVVGSGIVVGIASFKGLSQDPVATVPRSTVPPLPPSQRAITRPSGAGPLPAAKSADVPDGPVTPTATSTAAGERAQPPQRAMPAITPIAPATRLPVSDPRLPAGVGSSAALPMATSVSSPSPTTAPPVAIQPAAATPPTTPATPPAGGPPSAPPPPAMTGPLSGLDAAWRLPALISTVESAVSSLSEDPVEPVNLSLSSTAAAIGEAAAIFIERNESGLWTVCYVADLKMPESKAPLATLRLEGRQFKFAWTSQDLPELRRQVANCRLTVHHGSQNRTVQLRPVQEEAAIKLDLEKATLVRELAIADPPKPELLRLEITSLDAFEGNASVIVKSLPLAKETKIEFVDMPGAEIGVRFQKLPTGNLAVRLEPIFREGESKEFDLTLPKLKAFEDGVARALRTAERELPAEKRELASKQAALRKLQGSQPANPLAVPAWKQAVNDLAGDLDRTSRKVARLTRDIPLYKARLDAVPKVRDFLTKMHLAATIRLRIVAECGEHDLVLISATLDSQSAE